MRNGVDREFYERVYNKPSYRSHFEKWVTSIQPILIQPYDRLVLAMGDIKGKRVCEIGCGNGHLTSLLIKNGAIVSSSDVSLDAVREAQKYNDYKANIEVMDACHLLYGNEIFDFVVGCGILHHVNLDKVAKEIRRVLKVNGKAFFDEPLAHNPIANIWRKLTPSTKDINEKPLTYAEIEGLHWHFCSVKYQEYNLLPMLSTLSIWNKKKCSDILARLEPRFLRICKPLKRYCGSVLIELGVSNG
jgi:2-polyprenyl-3-methyl-5-hydroxy-6-metoxy-1,4-benzoquinol methylase